MTYWYPFKDPVVAERFAFGLLKAGIEGKPSGYYKTLGEDRLTGEEIRKLVFGQEFQTSFPVLGQINVTRTEDGIIEQSEWGTGKSRIEGDMLCDKWDSRFEGLEYCGTVFRIHEINTDTEDEYLYVTDFQFCKLSPAEEKPSGSYKILEENRLSGEEIRELLFGRRITGFIPESREPWWVEFSKDGRKIKYWTQNWRSGSGKSWVESDLYCEQWEGLDPIFNKCGYFYRNPDGTPEKKNEYLLVTKDRITPSSPVD